MQIRRFPQIPERIERLEELAYNLKWSWDYRARLLFKRLDPDLWKNTQHNPVKLLHDIEPVRLSAAARERKYGAVCSITMRALYRAPPHHARCFTRNLRVSRGERIARVPAESVLQTARPVYSGG